MIRLPSFVQPNTWLSQPQRGASGPSQDRRLTARFAAGGWNHVNLLVAIVLARESDPLSVRREFSKHLDARVRSQPHCRTTARRRRPKIAGISEDHTVATNIRKAQQLRL